MTDKREQFVRLIRQVVSISEACRRLGIDRKTGHWWKNGGSFTRNGVIRVVEPIMHQVPSRPESGRYLSAAERVTIADGVQVGRSARSLAAELDRAVSTVARELQRNTSPDGAYRPHEAQAMTHARPPRPKVRVLERDNELRGIVQGYLDQRWSPEQVAHARRRPRPPLGGGDHLPGPYSPQRVVEREPANVLRTGRPHRGPAAVAPNAVHGSWSPSR